MSILAREESRRRRLEQGDLDFSEHASVGHAAAPGTLIRAHTANCKVRVTDVIIYNGDASSATIIFYDEDSNVKLTASFSFDHYALCRRKSGGVDWIMLSGWDDGDFIWRKAANPWNPAGRLDEGPPLGCMHVVFNGVHVAPEVWKEAQGLFTEDSLSNR